MKAAALLLVAAIAAAGCGGGDDSNDFRKGYNAVVRQYSSLPGEVGTAVRGASAKTDKQLEAQFTDLADRLSDELAKLRKLHPPGRAKDEYKAFIDDLAKVEDDLDAIARSAKAHSAKQASNASKALVKDSTSVDKDEDALKKAVD